MCASDYSIGEQVKAFCARVGVDPLLVQGAGGNVSWKNDATLWIKASGTWLEDATDREIFVPVDLPHLQQAIQHKNFGVIPRLSDDSVLKPSIETVLHALMPQKIVVHLHAVEVLAHLVRQDCDVTLRRLLIDCPRWVLVDYYKPGEELAYAVSAAVAKHSQPQIIFLKNHGLVVGGNSIDEVDNILKTVIGKLTTNLPHFSNTSEYQPSDKLDQYIPFPDADVQRLAFDRELFKCLGSYWALYPDHVVFLGHQAHTYNSREDFFSQCRAAGASCPELVFIHRTGVFVKPTFNRTRCAQLRCYYDVMIRQDNCSFVCTLSPSQVSELLTWNAENYRTQVAK